MIEINGKYTNAKIMIDDIEPECLSQVIGMCNNKAFTNPIAIMPGCHAGKGSCVGFTMKLSDKVIPNVVSVDIGCGMLSFNIGNVNFDCKEIDDKIRSLVPMGMNVNKECKHNLGMEFKELCSKIGMDFSYAENSIGSIGSGNHFCEIGKSDKTSDVWITIHTGSRNLGKKVCEYWQNIAIKKSLNNGELFDDGVIRIKRDFPKSEWNKEISNLRNNYNLKKIRSNGLEYLENDDLKNYLHDMYLAQSYAKINRSFIMKSILKSFNDVKVIDMIETVHNYIDERDNIIRKGAIRSYIGEKMIIPLTPKAGILICTGKSNSEWNYSAPHGAGRIMSRSKSKDVISDIEAREAMKGVYSSCCPVDESPLVYKDPSVIEECIKPTANIIDRIIPIINIKDGSEEKSWKERRKSS